MAIAKRAKTVLLLHGWGGSFDSTFGTTELVDQLRAENFSVLEIDLPGHGSGSSSYKAEDYKDLAALVEKQLPEAPLVALGFSLGAKVLLELCVRHPTRFQRVVLGGLGDNVFKPEKLGAEVADALEAGVNADTPAGVIGLVEYSKVSKSDPLALAAVLRRPPNPTFTKEKLSAVVCPVYVINGWEDGVARPENELLSSISKCSLYVIPETNHFNLTGNKFFIDTAVSFLTEAS